MKTLSRKIHTFFHTPHILLKKFERTRLFRVLPDKTALKLQYKSIFGRKLDLKEPKTFNEKLQWLKLYNRKPEYTTMVDKYAAKKYVADIIGEEHIIPTLGVWEKFEDIDFDILPNQFVLKCTHGSGDVVICKNKAEFDRENAKKKLTKALKTNYYKISREWPYKNVPRRIIAEKYMQTNTHSGGINDYKFFCFDGEPKIMFIATDRSVDVRFDFFDMDFNHLDIENIHPQSGRDIFRPKMFEEMKQIAAKISEGIKFVRIDLYEIKEKIYFGEYTFFHGGGFWHFKPEKWEYRLGNWIDLK